MRSLSWLPLFKAWRAWRDPLAFLERVGREHGDLARLRLAGRHVFVLGHPCGPAAASGRGWTGVEAV